MNSTNSKRSASNNQVIQFFSLTFLFSWFLWLPGVLYTYQLIAPRPFILNLIEVMNWVGGAGPSVIAFILTLKIEGIHGAKILFNRVLRVKLGYWYFPIFLILPVILVLAHILNMILGGADFPKTGLLSEPWWILVVFLIFFILQFGEEFGWRGYALDRLQTRWNALISSIILGILWALWHLPMFLSKGFPHYDYHLPFSQLFITLVIASIFITWLQNNCKGSLIPALVIHTLINISGEVLPLIEKSQDVQGDYSAWIIVNILFTITVIFILLLWDQTTFKRK
jgi:membrane protease YdiL (CAAX protease family)